MEDMLSRRLERNSGLDAIQCGVWGVKMHLRRQEASNSDWAASVWKFPPRCRLHAAVMNMFVESFLDILRRGVKKFGDLDRQYSSSPETPFLGVKLMV